MDEQDIVRGMLLRISRGIAASTPLATAVLHWAEPHRVWLTGSEGDALDWPERAFSVRELPEEQGPGNILLLEAVYEHATEIVSGFGKLGVPAEHVAKRAAGRMKGYLDSSAFAGPYLADQLLLPFALAGGGCFTTVKPSEHSLTAATIIERFLGRHCVFSQLPGGMHLMELRDGAVAKARVFA